MPKNNKFWQFKNAAEGVGELSLYGDISSYTWWGDEVTPKQFKDDLDELGDISTLNVYINSPGGDVFAGQAIYSMLKRHKATINVYIDGLAASIASVVAMAGDRVIMPSNAMMMVHKPWSIMIGNADDFLKMAEDLEKIQGTIEETYLNKTDISKEKLKELMNAETWLSAQECLEYGFADEVEKEKQVAASIKGGFLMLNNQQMDLSKYENPPEFETTAEPREPPPSTDARLLQLYAWKSQQLERMIER